MRKTLSLLPLALLGLAGCVAYPAAPYGYGNGYVDPAYVQPGYAYGTAPMYGVAPGYGVPYYGAPLYGVPPLYGNIGYGFRYYGYPHPGWNGQQHAGVHTPGAGGTPSRGTRRSGHSHH